MNFTQLNFHGVTVSLGSPSPTLVADVRHDYHYFLTRGGQPQFRVLHHWGAPPDWGRGWKVGRSRLYRAPRRERRVNFFGKAWVSYRFDRGECEVWCEDESVAFEVIYLVVHAYVGERLDQRGWHRIHGLGVTHGEKASLFLAASGTGKSTLAMDLLADTDLGLLSDDMPIVDRGGAAHPFPQRIALKETPAVDSRYVREFRRVAYPPKYVVGAEYFQARIPQAKPIRRLVVTERRRPRAEPQLRRLRRWELIVPLLKWLVVGWETPQIWQLYLRGDVGRKTGILFTRLRTAWRLGLDCEGYAMDLGEDREANRKMAQRLGEGEATCV